MRRQFPEEQGGLLAVVGEAQKPKDLAGKACRKKWLSVECYCNRLVYPPRVMQYSKMYYLKPDRITIVRYIPILSSSSVDHKTTEQT